MRIFVSHASEDNSFCHAIVMALRDAGADVWYDEHNLSGIAHRVEIARQMWRRPVFLVVLSNAALTSSAVQIECKSAFNRYRHNPTHLILPVVGASYDLDDVETLGYLTSTKRIEAAEHEPLPPDEAARRLICALELTPAGEASPPVASQLTEDVDELLTRGRALIAQKQYAEALPLVERASQLAPSSSDAWIILSIILDDLGRPSEALAAVECAVAVYDAYDATTWHIKGGAFIRLGYWQEALASYDQALAHDPSLAFLWSERGRVLAHLERYSDALAAYDEALALNAAYVSAWVNKGKMLDILKRYDEALVAYDKANALDPYYPYGWVGRAATLRKLGRTAEAEEAERRAELSRRGKLE